MNISVSAYLWCCSQCCVKNMARLSSYLESLELELHIGSECNEGSAYADEGVGHDVTSAAVQHPSTGLLLPTYICIYVSKPIASLVHIFM